jgi:hypothetical protein
VEIKRPFLELEGGIVLSREKSMADSTDFVIQALIIFTSTNS